MGAAWTPLLLGRRHQNSRELNRDYKTRRIRLLFNKGPLFYAFFNIRLFFYLLFAKVDLIIANDLDTLPSVWLIGIIRRKPFVFDSHEYFTEVPELIDRPLVQKFWKMLERFLVPRTRYMLTVNEAIAHLFKKEYSVNSEILMNLPKQVKQTFKNSVFELPDSFKSQKIIIYQGAVNVGRGLEQMIDAISLIPDHVLLVVGDGDILHELKARVKQGNLQENVLFTGRLDMEELPALTAMATVGMSLEQDLGLNYRLAMPNKLFDYMKAGIPVVVSDLPLMSSLVRKEQIGMVAEAYDPESLKSIILEITSDQEQYEKWSKAAAKAAEKYTWESQEDVLIRLCDRALYESK